MSANSSADRLVFFTDAVVAIALTLLVLPLTEVVPDAVSEVPDSIDVVGDNGGRIVSFLLSFAVIAQFWMAHHRIFGPVRNHNSALVLMNLAWLLAIVVLPFPTELIGEYGDDRFSVVFYIGTMLVAASCQLVMVFLIHRDPALTGGALESAPRQRFVSVANTAVFGAAFALAFAIPRAGLLALLLLFLVPVVTRYRHGRQVLGPGNFQE